MTHLLRFVLEKNYIVFDNRMYLQTKETAMGTSFASVFAHLVMRSSLRIFTEISDDDDDDDVRTKGSRV
jgi:hypothetical protein